MPDAPNEETPDVPEDDSPVVPDALFDASKSIDLSPELAAVVEASADEVLGDLGSVDDIVGDAADVLAELDADLEPSDDVDLPARKPAPDLSTWKAPGFAVDRIDVSAHAHDSTATPAERFTLILLPLLVIVVFAAVALLVL
ncbi:MAG: hypothetical protein HKN46_01820 [Acidimicrobiia bacterium]|nr:hypothetical protein [Acidimicrobiia bacterium]